MPTGRTSPSVMTSSRHAAPKRLQVTVRGARAFGEDQDVPARVEQFRGAFEADNWPCAGTETPDAQADCQPD